MTHGSHGMSVLSSALMGVRSEHPLLYFGVPVMLMVTIGVVLGLYSLEQYTTVKALPFEPTLLAVILTFWECSLFLSDSSSIPSEC